MRPAGGGTMRAAVVNNLESAAREGAESPAARQPMGALLCVTELMEKAPKIAESKL